MTILELGAEGGSVVITKKNNSCYSLTVQENIDDENDSLHYNEEFSSVQNAWNALTQRYSSWRKFVPIEIASSIQPLVQQALQIGADSGQVTHWRRKLKLSIYTDKTYDSVIADISANAKSIIKNLEEESLAVYAFLQDRFNQYDTASDGVFQFLFRSFYRLDNAGLSSAFKRYYFRILEDYKGKEIKDEEQSLILKNIVDQLRQFPTLRQERIESTKGSVQFSFATKLLNTVSNRAPIYDAEVRLMFGLSDCSYITDPDKRLARLCEYYEVIRSTYETGLIAGDFDTILMEFNRNFKNFSQIPEIKKLDFIFWSAGKLKRKGDL